MAKTGRPRTPTALKVLQGNPGKHPLPQHEPKPAPKRPQMPAYLGALAQKRWNELVFELERIGVVTTIDGDVLAGYCQAVEDVERFTKFLRRRGRTYRVGTNGAYAARPEVQMRYRALDDIRRFGAELGIGAASRSKIEVKKPDADANPLAEILGAAQQEAAARRRQG